MKKQLITILFAFMSLMTFAQNFPGNGNTWYVQSTPSAVTSDGVYPATGINLRLDATDIPTYQSPGYESCPTLTANIMFVKQSGTVRPNLTVDGHAVVWNKPGTIGNVQITFNPSWNLWYPNGNSHWSGLHGLIVYANGGDGVYNVSFSTFGNGVVCSSPPSNYNLPTTNFTSNTWSTLTITPPQSSATPQTFTITGDAPALTYNGEYTTLTITTSGNCPVAGSPDLSVTKISGPATNYGSVSLTYVSGSIDCMTGNKTFIYHLTQTAYVGSANSTVFRVTLNSVSGNYVGTPYYYDVMIACQNC
jgi:hypothetical protein